MNSTTEKYLKSKRSYTVEENILQKTEQEYYNNIPTLIRGQISGKRVVDILLGSATFVVFSLLFPFIAFGIKLNSPGKVIYKQKRTGLNGKVFVCYKFRTMHSIQKTQNKNQPIITEKGDIRIFKFGNFLRKTNLDELPQIMNVLKGDMSFVGPRPYPVDECKHWNNTFDDFYYRYMVKPGITGFAQVSGYRGGTLDENHMRRRLDKDLVYIEKQSLYLDFKILYKTVYQMVSFTTDAH